MWPCVPSTRCKYDGVFSATALNPEVDEALRPLGAEKRLQLAAYIETLLRHAQLFNLTAIQDPNEAWSRHVLETLRFLPLLGDGTNLIDVGSGGGIPGIVLAIARPELSVTLLEVTQKKAKFLEQTAATLRLSNVTVLAERAESAAAPGAPHREHYDIVTARAVAPMRVLLELTSPFAKVGGRIVAIKGEKAGAEMDEAANALAVLRVEHESTVRHPTATIVTLRKTAATPPKYPRRSGEPKRNPL